MQSRTEKYYTFQGNEHEGSVIELNGRFYDANHNELLTEKLKNLLVQRNMMGKFKSLNEIYQNLLKQKWRTYEIEEYIPSDTTQTMYENTHKRHNPSMDNPQHNNKNSDNFEPPEEFSHESKKPRKIVTPAESNRSLESFTPNQPVTSSTSIGFDPIFGFPILQSQVVDHSNQGVFSQPSEEMITEIPSKADSENPLDIDQHWNTIIIRQGNFKTYYSINGQVLALEEVDIWKKLTNYSLIKCYEDGAMVEREIFSEEQYFNIKKKAETVGVDLNQYRTYLEFFTAYQSIQQTKLDQQADRLKNKRAENQIRANISSEERSVSEAAKKEDNYLNLYHDAGKRIAALTSTITSYQHQMSSDLQRAATLATAKERISNDINCIWQEAHNFANSFNGPYQSAHESQYARSKQNEAMQKTQIADDLLRARMNEIIKGEQEHNMSAICNANQIQVIKAEIKELEASALSYLRQANAHEAEKNNHLQNIAMLKQELARVSSIYNTTVPLYNSVSTTSTTSTTASNTLSDPQQQPKV